MAENLKSETNKLITGEKSSQTNVSSVIRIWDKFSVIQEIASGGYGKVFSVQNNFDKSKYSVKIIDLKTFGYEEIALKEIELLAKLESEYIVHYKSSWIEFDIKRTLLYIQTELCDRNLKDFLNDINSDIKLKNQNILTLLGYYICSEITEEIFEGINYLHKQNISQLFLNPTNILLKNVLIGKVIRIKVFTSAAKQELIKQNILEETCEYIAPEVFDNDFNETKADIFSLGIILEELFSIDLKRKYFVGERKSKLLMIKYKQILKMLYRMKQIDPMKRPDCEEILNRKLLWSLNDGVFDVRKEFKVVFDFEKTIDNSYINSILNLKSKETLYEINKYLIKPQHKKCSQCLIL